MYQRGIIHIVMIIVGLMIVAILIGMFSMSSSRTMRTQTVEYYTD